MYRKTALHKFVIYVALFGVIRAHMLKLPQCNKYAGRFTVIHREHKLVNSVTLALHVVDVNLCIYTCMQHLKCKSCSISEDEGMCLLHYKKNEEDNAYLVKADGWMFLETNDEEHLVSKLNYHNIVPRASALFESRAQKVWGRILRSRPQAKNGYYCSLWT